MFQYGEQILNMAVLSIVISAPLGAVLILATGPLLLHSDLEVKGNTDEVSDLEENEKEEQEDEDEEREEEERNEEKEEKENEKGVEEIANKSVKNESKMLKSEMESVEVCQGDLSVDNKKIGKEHLS